MAITVYVKSSVKPNLYVWTDDKAELNGAWPGTAMSATTDIDGTQYYCQTFAGEESINIILNNNGQKTADITGITYNTYFDYDGGTGYNRSDKPFENGGEEPGGDYSYTIYWDNSASTDWQTIKMYVYGDGNDDYLGNWSGCPSMTLDQETGYYKWSFSADKDLSRSNVIFHNNNGRQTGDGVLLRDKGIYCWNGDRQDCFTGEYVTGTGIENIYARNADISVRVYNGDVYVTSKAAGDITIVRADGTYMRRHIDSGINRLEGLQPGVYIINRTKIVL